MLGEKINERLTELNMTQADLQRESGISKAYVSQLVTGKSPSPSYKMLKRLARALDTSVDYLMGDASECAQSCETCRFSKSHETDWGGTVYFCHRYPPQHYRESTETDLDSRLNPIYEMVSYSAFPETQKTNWCGEWKAR